MSKHRKDTATDCAKVGHNATKASDNAPDFDGLFSSGEISFSDYIAAKKNVTLSGSYTLDSTFVVDNEEIIISGGSKPLIIVSSVNPAFLVINGGKLKLSKVELRAPISKTAAKEPLRINLFGKKFNLSNVGQSEKDKTAIIDIKEGSLLEFKHSVIEGASNSGINIDHSEALIEDSEINHCRKSGLTLKDSSVSIKKSVIAENGTRGLKNHQILADNSTLSLERCVVRTSRGGDGIALKNSSRAEIRGGHISGNSGNGLSLYDASQADISDCKLTENGAPDSTCGQIYLRESSALIKNCSINDSRGGIGIALSGSEATVENCSIKNNSNRGLSVINSSNIKIIDCSIRENAVKGRLDTQIFVEKSSIVMEKCSINESRGNGIIFEKEAQAILNGCVIKNNMGNAVSVFQKSRAQINDCKITGNGREKKTFAQILLDQQAVAEITNCEITDSVGGPGIVLLRESEISVSSCVICRNGDNGITAVLSPRVEIRDCKMMWNGSVGDCYCHIYLDKSNAIIERCHIYENHYGYAVFIHGKKRLIRKNSFCDVTIRDCVMERNKLGLRVNNLSKLRMSNTKVINNKEGDTFYEPEAVVLIEDANPENN